MGFVDDISDYRSLAIVGLEKNTGKTECLNYILRRIKDSADRFALTSIGYVINKTHLFSIFIYDSGFILSIE